MRLLAIILLFASATTLAQSYTVIHAIGKIQDTQSGTYLAKGTKIDESASLKFETKGAKAAVLSASRGRFVIQEAAQSDATSDVVYALSSVVSPVRGKLSTRAGGINNRLDFEKYFSEGPVAILGDSFSMEVSTTSYPMDKSRFFYAQYVANGETINKKLSGEDGNLVLRIADFFSVDGKPIAPQEVSEMKLFYYDANTQESSLITEMAFGVASNDELLSIADQVSGDQEALLEVINSLYGKCAQSYLATALEAIQ